MQSTATLTRQEICSSNPFPNKDESMTLKFTFISMCFFPVINSIRTMPKSYTSFFPSLFWFSFMSSALLKFHNLGSKFLSSKTCSELIPKWSIFQLQQSWRKDKPLANPSAILSLIGQSNGKASFCKGRNQSESLPFGMSSYTRILCFLSVQNPRRSTKFPCLNLCRITILRQTLFRIT
ncbi:hypothetical protein V8G54_001064 [Vigna mungo]|uniref:Uncharacterized protein n=1 Tax=Vigna mungo TaxID=3915 RepID=A0AAQ3P7M5_VIGMU